MGLLDGIRGFVGKSIKKEEKKLRKQYHADEYTKKQIREMAAGNVIKRGVKKATFGLAAVATVGTIATGINKKENKAPINNPVEVETMLDNLNENVVDEKTDIKETLSQIDAIKNDKDSISFFKKLYLDEYNKENNTDYTEENISFYSQNQDKIYDLGNICLTHGSYPEGIELKLENQGIDYEECKGKLYSVMLNKENGEKEYLENITIGKDGKIKNVVLGDDFAKGEELKNPENSTLVYFGNVIKCTVDLSTNYQNMSENSIKENTIEHNKLDLKEAVTQYYKGKQERELAQKENAKDDLDKIVEKDAQMGVR